MAMSRARLESVQSASGNPLLRPSDGAAGVPDLLRRLSIWVWIWRAPQPCARSLAARSAFSWVRVTIAIPIRGSLGAASSSGFRCACAPASQFWNASVDRFGADVAAYAISRRQERPEVSRHRFPMEPSRER
jgi:hypothetical protein